MESDMHCAFNAKCHYLHYKNGYQYLYHQMYGGEINSLELVEYLKICNYFSYFSCYNFQC